MTHLWSDKELKIVGLTHDEEDKSLVIRFNLFDTDSKLYSSDTLAISGVKEFSKVIDIFNDVAGIISSIDLSIDSKVILQDKHGDRLAEIYCHDYSLTHKRNYWRGY